MFANNSVHHVLAISITWRMSFANTWLHLRFLVSSLLLIYLVFCAFCVFLVFILGTVCSTFPVSLNFQFLIAALVFSNVYLGGEYRKLQLLNHEIMINIMVPLYQAHATLPVL